MLSERTPEAKTAYAEGWMAGATWAIERAAVEMNNATIHLEVALRDNLEAVKCRLAEAEAKYAATDR